MGENTRSTGANTDYPSGAIALQLSGLDEVTLYRSDNGETQNFRFSVVEWPTEPLRFEQFLDSLLA